VIYLIIPVPKPRMTRGDKRQKRPRGTHYRAFKQECQLKRVRCYSGDNVTFIMPMAKSWSKKKRDEMLGQPHTQTPDLDNLLKALWDACLDDDAHIHTITARKIWGLSGKIEIKRGIT